jgi:tetratricopeptide (TPR) repeat protein
MKRAPLALLVLALTTSRLATCQTSEEQIEQSFRAGQDALRSGEPARAAEEFKRVLALDPTLVEAEVNLGLAYQSMFQYELAVRHISKALLARPNLVGANVIVGMDYVKLGSPEKATPFLQRALKLDPSNLDARQALASAYQTQQNFRGAAEEFRQIAALDSDKAEAWFKLGHEYLDLAARLAFRGAHLYRESAWGHRFLGDLLLQRDRWDDAAQEYRKALASDSRQSGLHTSLGLVHLHSGKFQEAEAEFRQDLQLDPKNEPAWLGLANLQLLQNDTTKALESAAKVWEISPEFLVVQREFPAIQPSQDSAKALFSQLQDAPDAPAKQFLMATLYGVSGQSAPSDREWKWLESNFLTWQKAKAAQRSLIAEGPCKEHFYSRCAASMQAGKRLTNPDRLLLGKAQFTLQRYELAADAFEQVQGISNENAEASYWLARTYQALGAQAYAQLQESFPDSWRSHQLRAEGYGLRGNLDDAVKEYQAALKLRPNEPELHEALGQLYLDNHNDDGAESELEKVLALDGSRTHALYLLGRLSVQKRENEQAVSYLQRALRLQPDLGEASGLLGTAYVRLGQFADAVPKLEKAASLDHYGNVHYQLFLAYRKLGQTELAQKALARSQELRRSSLERDQALILGSPQVDSDPQ